MRNTSDLIDALADSVTPVRRLYPPFLRAALWLSLAAIVLALLCLANGGVRADISIRLQQPAFVVSMIGALADFIDEGKLKFFTINSISRCSKKPS